MGCQPAPAATGKGTGSAEGSLRVRRRVARRMAGGRGPAPCGRDGCGGPGTGTGVRTGRAVGRSWLPRARWLARRLAALLVLLALVAAGCVLRRRACPASRRRPLPARRRPLPAPGAAAPPPGAGGPADEPGPELELPPLPRYEEVKHLPSYEEAQGCPRRSPPRGRGGLRLNPSPAAHPRMGRRGRGWGGDGPPDGMPGIPGRRDGGHPQRDGQRSPGGMRGQTRRSFGGTERHCLEGRWGPPGERPSPGNIVHRGPRRDGSLDTGLCRRDVQGSQRECRRAWEADGWCFLVGQPAGHWGSPEGHAAVLEGPAAWGAPG
ncbi:uncharacterized membrane protein C3orf80 homolog [Aquila chrysaetos chrysaetos]|uniref:uncharacterized membrane protein C3orf80 homolog n=1 Tax=Aquila chrysaetos chrysaetos TaxID=223781 RepID=UPI001176974A|nr:uncharacterized membrane protein C3orf80 homolog [Aquila chrysaetos chrysaetos]